MDATLAAECGSLSRPISERWVRLDVVNARPQRSDPSARANRRETNAKKPTAQREFYSEAPRARATSGASMYPSIPRPTGRRRSSGP